MEKKQILTAENLKFNAEVARLQEEVSRLKEIGPLTKDAAIQALNDRLDLAQKSYNDEKTKSERLIANLEENIKELKKEKRKTQALEVESRRLTNESEQAKETHEEALKRNAERILALETAETSHNEAQTELNETVLSLKGDLDKERERAQTLENENHYLANELNQANAACVEERRENADHILVLEGKATESEEASRRLRQEIANINTSWESSESARNEALNDLAKRNEIIQTLESKAVELEKKSKGLELEIIRLNAVLEEAKGEGKKGQMAIDKYTQTLRVDLDKEKVKTQTLENEKLDLANELNQAKAKFEELKKKNDEYILDLEGKAEESKEAKQKAQSRNRRYKYQISEFRSGSSRSTRRAVEKERNYSNFEY